MMFHKGYERKIDQLVNELTLEEKIKMIHGAGLFRTGAVERLGIPPIVMSDGPTGVRFEFFNDNWGRAGHNDDGVTYCPSNSAIAATWNRELAGKSGTVLGEEARGRGKDIILAPGVNVMRTPLCGRNFEYFSEDPYLISEMAVPVIEGIESSDVGACVKHFAVNNQETERNWVNVEIDERTLREIYLPAFEAAVKKAKVRSIMGAYNLFRGVHCCENNELLGEILRKEWNYDGLIVSDWGGIHDTKAAAESPIDVEMSIYANFDEYCMADPLLNAVRNGEIEEERVDEKVKSILRFMLRVKMIDIVEAESGDNEQTNMLSGEGKIIIADTGCGFSSDDIETKWAVIGTSSKVKNPYSKKYKRRCVGRKGIGRYSVERLAEYCTLYSFTKDNRPVKYYMNWNKYEGIDFNELKQRVEILENSPDFESAKYIKRAVEYLLVSERIDIDSKNIIREKILKNNKLDFSIFYSKKTLGNIQQLLYD